MNLIFSVSPKHSVNIFKGNSPFVFQIDLGKNVYVGSKIFFYKRSCNPYERYVIGEGIIEEIIPMIYPRCCGPDRKMIREYAKINNDDEVIKALDKLGNFNLTHYKDETILSFLLCGSVLENAIKNDEYPPEATDMSYYLSHPEYISKREKTQELLNNVDNWLRNMGFYNNQERSFYRYALKVKSLVKYTAPVLLSQFQTQHYTSFTRPPSTWAYTLTN